MKIWIVNPYGALPSEGWREYRSFMLAKALVARGHEVTWWISDFVHRSKTYRAGGELHEPLLPDGIRVIAVHSTSYQRNISWRRIQYEANYGKEFARLAENEVIPNVIVMGDPALFFSKSVLAYRNNAGCKLVLDVIDLWPELFVVAFPKWLQPAGRWILYPLYERRRKLVERCDGVVAVSCDYLNVALEGQSKAMRSMVAYWGIDTNGYQDAAINSALNAELQVFKNRFALIAVYAGTLGDAYDMDIVIAAVKKAKSEDLPIGFVVAGDGPHKQRFLDMAGIYESHLKFVGALPASDMTTLYTNCDVGLMTYVTGSTVAMPIKFFDYLVGGLAIFNSLDRDVRETIREHEVGLNYRPMDPNDLITKLLSLVNDPRRLDQYKVNAKNLSRRYDTKNQYEIFSLFVEQIANDSI